MSRLDDALPELYDELRRIAERALRGERPGHTLQATALVHEAYLKLAATPDYAYLSRDQLLGAAARAMRRVLVDHARRRRRDKRGGDILRVTLSPELATPEPGVDLLALDEALERLAALDERQVRIVELRFIAGLSVEETATLLGLSPTSVKRDTMMARAWLLRELGTSAGGS